MEIVISITMDVAALESHGRRNGYQNAATVGTIGMSTTHETKCYFPCAGHARLTIITLK